MKGNLVSFFKNSFIRAKTVMAQKRQILHSCGITFSDGIILAALNGIPRLKMSDIAKEMFSTRPAATQCVDRLMARGLVSRFRSQDKDRRIVWVRITSKGKRLLKFLGEKLGIVS